MSKVKDSTILKTTLMIVEGIDEQRVFTKILGILNNTKIQIIPHGGKTLLSDYLKNVLTKDPNFNIVTSIGIIRDADENPVGAFEAVCYALKNCGLDIPNRENEKTIGKPTIAVTILPGSGRTGSLEDVFLDSVVQNQIYSCVEGYFMCLKDKQNGTRKQLGKAKVHTYLASNLNDPDKRLGESVEADFWDFNHPSFKQVIDFVKLL